ncbi:hypothetical protein XENTR_v10019989 [Xenopus tropicalis]|nr:hypothetical protein XENTR_v10019989 [Xenopus tropicalis]
MGALGVPVPFLLLWAPGLSLPPRYTGALWDYGDPLQLQKVHFAPNRFDPIIERDIDHLAALLAKQDSGSPTQDGNTTQSQPLQNGPPSGAAGRSGTPAGSTAMPRRGATKPANDALLLGVVVGCAIAGLVALVVAGIYWCRMHREMKLAQKVDYTSYKSSPPPPYEKTSPGDKKLAQSAQMYHYQHQKQQMISMEKNKDEPKHPDSALTSEDENEDGDFTVYECPGLAPVSVGFAPREGWKEIMFGVPATSLAEF